jgi:predicted Zn-dependent protease
MAYEPCVKNYSDKEEAEAGKSLFQKSRDKYPFLDTIKYDKFYKYYTTIGRNIVNNQNDRIENEYIKFRFYILAKDSQVIAYSQPGGYVLLSTAIIYWCGSEAQLAAILSHEVAHITQRHSIKEACRIDMSQLDAVKYTAEIEGEADSLAVKYLIANSYNPMGLVHFLDTLIRIRIKPATHEDLDARKEKVLNQINATQGIDSLLTEKYLYTKRFKDTLLYLWSKDGIVIRFN